MEDNGKKKLLLIDDSETELHVAANLFKDNYELFTAKSGKEALGYLTKGIVPDLILLDVLMPDMDGWETFNLIKGISLLRNVPIAFFTSIDGEWERQHASVLGAVDYITKPFENDELIKRVDAIIESRKQITENS